MDKGKRIKFLREKAGMSQDELAQKLNTTKQTIYKYEMGIVTNIPSDKIEKMALIFHISPAYIMGWTDEITPTNSDTSFSTLSEEEQKILKNFRTLNDLGKSRALEYVEDLTYNEKYTREQFFDEESSGA
ncbi:MAG: helix-turn-helix domain-containing protein [Monoglobales bacterium]